MKKQIESLMPNGTMQLDYEAPARERIRLSLTVLDELEFPVERRGYQTNIPGNPDDQAGVAKAIGEAAERTARLMLGLSIEEIN